MPTLRVRPATDDDVPALREVGQRTWPPTYAFAGADYIEDGLRSWWSEEAVRRGLRTTRTLVVERDGQVIGMGNLDTRSETPIIWKLYVLPEHQGTGAGHALMTALLALVPDQDVTLEYADGNTPVVRFYERHGFVEQRREPSEHDGWPDQVWMVRRRHERG